MQEKPTICAICGGGHETSAHPKIENETTQDEDLQRKLSRVALNTGKHERKGLFDRLTSRNTDRISAALDKPPIFYENDADAESSIELDDEIRDLMPPVFFENPTAWIESQKSIERHHDEEFLPRGKAIRELFDQPYDVSKVKHVKLGEGDTKDIVIKRLAPGDVEEVAVAQKAYQAGIPTPKVLGEVSDHGNRYAFFEYLEGMSAYSLGQKYDIAWTRKAPESSSLHANNLQDLIGSNAKRFSSETQAELFGLWEKEKRHLYLVERFNKIKTVLVRELSVNPDGDPAVIILRDSRYPGESETTEEALSDCNEASQLFGYASLEDFIQKLREQDKRSYGLDDRESEQRQELLANYKAEWRNVVEMAVYGCDLEAEKSKLLSACDEAGIQHHDFTDLNLLIPWDFKNDRPKREEGKAPIYVLDWEQRKSSSKTENPQE